MLTAVNAKRLSSSVALFNPANVRHPNAAVPRPISKPIRTPSITLDLLFAGYPASV